MTSLRGVMYQTFIRPSIFLTISLFCLRKTQICCCWRFAVLTWTNERQKRQQSHNNLYWLWRLSEEMCVCVYSIYKTIKSLKWERWCLGLPYKAAPCSFLARSYFIFWCCFCHMALDINELASSANEHDILMNSVCFSNHAWASNCRLVDTQAFSFPH